MKQVLFALIFLFINAVKGNAGDHKVVLYEEHYKEQMIVGGGESKIYHTWQVKTLFGDKLLILTGEDYGYRKWLRRYEHNHQTFIVKIPDQGDDSFIYSKIIYVNIQQIHPVVEKNWKCNDCRHGHPPARP